MTYSKEIEIRGNHGTIQNYGIRPSTKSNPSDPNFDAPDRILFIYMRLNKDGDLVVDHYHREILRSESVEFVEIDLFYNARPRTPYDEKNPKPIGHNFDTSTFCFSSKASYLTILLDEQLMSFSPGVHNRDIDPIVFISGKDIALPDGSLNQKKYDPNYCYYDLKSFRIKGRPALRMTNFLLDENKQPMGAVTVNHAFNIGVDVELAANTKMRKDFTIIFDPDPPSTGPKNP
jgi:hypothetical protein